MTDRKAKADLLITWLSDMMSRVEDVDDRRVLKDTIKFLNEVCSEGQSDSDKTVYEYEKEIDKVLQEAKNKLCPEDFELLRDLVCTAASSYEFLVNRTLFVSNL